MRRLLPVWLASIALCVSIAQAADPDHFKALAADRTAHQIRWGAITADSGRGPERFVKLVPISLQP